MSKLILTGDTNNNFGKLLPAPYIDKIYINEGEVTIDDIFGDEAKIEATSIDVDIEIYIRAEENEDITTLVKQLEDLRVYWFYASTEEFEWDLDTLKDKKQNIWNFYEEARVTRTQAIMVFELSNIAYDDDGALTHTIVYDDDGYRALKFKYSSKDFNEQLYYIEGADVWSEATADDGDDAVAGDVYLFAFATFDDPTTDEDATSFWYEYGGDYDDRHGKLLTIETGDVAYDAVWVDGEPAWGEQIIWVDGDDNLYDDVPLQSLSSKYYSIEKMSHSEIVSSFEDLLESYETKAETDDILQDTMDQISYILETNGADINLLSQLNKLSRAFPSKSSATATGLLYIDYNKKISAANAVIETGTQVYRKVMINSKVVDEREGEEAEFTEPTYDDIERDVGPDYDSDDYFVSNMILSRDEIEVSEGQVANNYGYVFFDYEKALYETAALGEYIHMTTIYNILGRRMLNEYFKLSAVTNTRNGVDLSLFFSDPEEYDSYEEIARPWSETITTFKENGYEMETTTWEDTGTEDGWTTEHTEPFVVDSSGYIAYSFLLLRNFELTREDGWDSYRMMCFEIQDFDDIDEGSAGLEHIWSRYTTTVTVTDNTTQMILDLITEYKNLYASDGGLLEYYIDAIDPANYSSEDKWTDSFQALMHDIYDDDEGNAPWILYPTYYCVFLDLFTGVFDGDSDKVADEVNKIVSRINPYNGSLTELDKFQEAFRALADDGAMEDARALVDTGDDGTVESVVRTYSNVFGYGTDTDLTDSYSSSPYEYTSEYSLRGTSAYAVSESDASLKSADTPSIEATSYSPSDGEEDVSDSKSDTRPKVTYRDYGTSESNGFYIGGTQLQASDDVVSYFTVTSESDDSVPIKKVTVRWTAFSLAFVVQFKNNLDKNTEYKWSFTNGTDSTTMITDEHLLPLGDFELTFRTTATAEAELSAPRGTLENPGGGFTP